MTKPQEEQEKIWLHRNYDVDYANHLIDQAERLRQSVMEPNPLPLGKYWRAMARYHDWMATALTIKANAAEVKD